MREKRRQLTEMLEVFCEECVTDPLEFSSNKNMLDFVFDSVDLLQKRKEFTTEDDSNVDKP